MVRMMPKYSSRHVWLYVVMNITLAGLQKEPALLKVELDRIGTLMP